MDIPDASERCMTVKDKVGRKRYVVFKLGSSREIERGELIYAFNRLPSKPYLIILERKGGIIRCIHRKLDVTMDDLNGSHPVRGGEVEIETVKVAGSMRKAKQILNCI